LWLGLGLGLGLADLLFANNDIVAEVYVLLSALIVMLLYFVNLNWNGFAVNKLSYCVCKFRQICPRFNFRRQNRLKLIDPSPTGTTMLDVTDVGAKIDGDASCVRFSNGLLTDNVT